MRKFIAAVALAFTFIFIFLSLEAPTTLTIHFETMGISNIESINVVDGEQVTLPNELHLEGHYFKYWVSEINSNDEWLLSEHSFQEHEQITLFPKWEKIEPIEYHLVTFDFSNGFMKTIMVFDDTLLLVPALPTKEGYELKGWYYGYEQFDFSQTITKDIILVAVWETI